MKLTIAIPDLNEEDSIISIIERTLNAREYTIANSPVTEVDIAVVSDGSTDKTVERASSFRDKIRLIVSRKIVATAPQSKRLGANRMQTWLDFLMPTAPANRDFSRVCVVPWLQRNLT